MNTEEEMEGDFSSRKRPRLGVVDKSTDLSGPSASPSSDTNRRAGDHISAYPGTVNKSAGSGDHFPGASFSDPVYLGKTGRFVDSVFATHQATQAQKKPSIYPTIAGDRWLSWEWTVGSMTSRPKQWGHAGGYLGTMCIRAGLLVTGPCSGSKGSPALGNRLCYDTF